MVRFRYKFARLWNTHGLGMRTSGLRGGAIVKRIHPLQMPEKHIIFIRSVDKGFWGDFKAPGETHDLGRAFRHDRPFPTIVDLNFDASALCDTFPFGNSTDDCVAWTAFMSLAMRWGSSMNMSGRISRDATVGSFLAAFKRGRYRTHRYDEDSTMNYCSDGAGTNQGQSLEARYCRRSVSLRP